MTMLTQDVKKVIQPIKAQGAPLEEYFKICQDIGSEPYKMQLLAQALSKANKKTDMRCHQCGKLGHIKTDCKGRRRESADKLHYWLWCHSYLYWSWKYMS